MRGRVTLSVLALAACGEGAPTLAGPGADAGAAPDGASADASLAPDAAAPGPRYTYFRDVKPIVDARCKTCHAAGGIGPFALTSYAEVFAMRAPLAIAVEARSMPPWHAAEGCGSFSNDRSLSEVERALLLEWARGEAAEGRAEEEPPPIPPSDPGLSRVDRRLPVEAEYAPKRGDDYRCFVLDWPDATDGYLTGYDVRPSNPALVHHVNLYSVAPAQAESFRRRAAGDPGPGYSCFGGVFTTGVALVGSWAPGSHGVDLPANAGMLVEPGSVIVAEMHFNTDAGGGVDRSEIVFSVAPEVSRRALIIPFWNFFEWSQDGGMRIPSGADDVRFGYEYDPGPYRNIAAPWIEGDEVLVHAVGLHMHQLGKQGRLELRRPGEGPACMLDIPRWDFHWQTSYTLSTPQPFTLGVDRLFVECAFDNTAAKQPIVDGQRQPPRDVYWGTGSRDEMCIGYVLVTER